MMRVARGFTLLEVVIALAVLSTGVLAMSALMLSTRHAGVVAGELDVAQLAARAKLEELRALAWTADGAAVPVSDWSTDLTITPPAISGGPGLGASPGDTLRANVDGYCDFLDLHGRWISAGTRPPPDASWVRRWMVQPDADRPEMIAVQVLVVPVRRSIGDTAIVTGRAMSGAWLMTLRTRRSR